MERLLFVKIILVGILFSNCSDLKIVDDNYNIPFKKLSSKETGIDFSNIIIPNLETKENLFDYDYFYNGAGVGVEDINNDGLMDIIFCGNQVPNKLFLNKLKIGQTLE